MATIINILIGLVVGLLTGLLSGYFFERRATKAAERENETLRAELRALRESVYSVGAERSKSVRREEKREDLAGELKAWIEARQDAEGKILFARAAAEFITRGFSREEVTDATEELCARGCLAVHDGWVHVT